MSSLRKLIRSLCFWRTRKLEAEMNAEMRSHLEGRIAEHVAAGLSAQEAREAAQREFGHVDRFMEEWRDQSRNLPLTHTMRDLRLAVRRIGKTPGFSMVAVGTLALGIGASATIFSLIETFLLRPLPYRDPAALVYVSCVSAGIDQSDQGISVPEYEDLRDHAGVFAELSMVWPTNCNLTAIAEPQRIEAMAVNPGFFRMLGAHAALGRVFGAEEEAIKGWAPGVVISYHAWQTYFGGDPNIIGHATRFDYDPGIIIGVMPPDFAHPGSSLSGQADMWYTGGMRTAPFGDEPRRDLRLMPSLIGRLKPGIGVEEARARLAVFAANLRAQYPDYYPEAAGWTPRIEPLQRELAGKVGPVLWMLFGAVGIVLLVCCATVANLFVVRAAGRRQELAVRVALGATRAALIRQFCAETLVMALSGGLLGLALAAAVPTVIWHFLPESLPRINEPGLNAAVMGFAFVVSVGAALTFGLIPAWRASRFELVSNLKDGGHGALGSVAVGKWRTVFTVAQIALSLALLATGGVLVRSFRQATQVAPGFEPRNLLLAQLWLTPGVHPSAQQKYNDRAGRVAFARTMVTRLRALPGVETVAVGSGRSVPLDGAGSTSIITAESHPVTPGTEPTAHIAYVSPDYFRTLQARLMEGRFFEESDEGERHVVIVNQAAAARLWPDGKALHRQIAPGRSDKPAWWTVVGVVENVKASALDAPDAPHVYFPLYVRAGYDQVLFIRARGDVRSLLEPVRQTVRAADPEMPVFGVRPMESVVSGSLAQRRFAVIIVVAFALATLALVALGLYGVLALAVAQRTREIGVRVALGATRAQIIGLIARQGIRIFAVGTVLGLAVAALLTRALRGFLFEISPLDPITFGAIVGLLALITALATWLPAWRATRINPTDALRPG